MIYVDSSRQLCNCFDGEVTLGWKNHQSMAYSKARWNKAYPALKQNDSMLNQPFVVPCSSRYMKVPALSTLDPVHLGVGGSTMQGGSTGGVRTFPLVCTCLTKEWLG